MSHLVAVLAVTLTLQTQPQAEEVRTPPDPLSALQTAIIEAIERAEQSVVSITRARSEDGTTLAVVGQANRSVNDPLAGQLAIDRDELASPEFVPMPGDFGSGVVIGPEGQILTTFHLVRGSARIFVRAPGGVSFHAQILAADPRSDLAVLVPRPTLDDEPAPELTPLPLGDADALRKGSFLIALGNPYNSARDGKAAASWGILSSTARSLVPPLESPGLPSPEARQAFRYLPTLLQLDTKLNLGMSGGAVVNLKGELVGVTTNGGNVEGFDAQAGYAIPLDATGRRVVEALRAGREAEYGFLGIRLNAREPNVVGGLEPGTPAAVGGLVLGDEILAVADRPVPKEGGLSLALGAAPIGKPVELTIRRGNQTLTKTVFLSKYPTAGEVIATRRPEAWRGLRIDFTSVLATSTLDDTVLESMAQGSVGIIEIEPGSPAEAAGLRRGQVITAVEETPVRSPDEFTHAVRNAGAKPVTLTIAGPTGERTIEIPAP